jgi:hypothetical protein
VKHACLASSNGGCGRLSIQSGSRYNGLRGQGVIWGCPKWIPVKTVKLRANRKIEMAKSAKKLKKANHGKRPASAKARKAKRKHIKT